MTVYVDDMYLTPLGAFHGMRMSHLIADTEAELHAMADTIGMARRWHQAPPRHDSHYDVPEPRRRLAIAAGAVEITLETCALMCMVRRRTGTLPRPEQAQEASAAVLRASAAGRAPPSPYVKRIIAPWSQADLAGLAAWQEDPGLPPYTCPRHHPDQPRLVPRRDGWACPGCDFSQRWAWQPRA